MIIKFQVKDSKYIYIIKKFLDDKALFDIAYFKSEEELKQFKNDIDNTNVIKYKCKSDMSKKTEIQKNMQTTIQQVFTNYLNTKNTVKQKKDILKNTDIKVVNLIMDINFNSERIYYIESIDEYIVM